MPRKKEFEYRDGFDPDRRGGKVAEFGLWRMMNRAATITSRTAALRGSFALALEKAAALPNRATIIDAMREWARVELRDPRRKLDAELIARLQELGREGWSAQFIADNSEEMLGRRLGKTAILGVIGSLSSRGHVLGPPDLRHLKSSVLPRDLENVQNAK